MRAFAAACLLAGLAPCTAAAQGGKALTLTIEEAIFLALKNSRTAIAARLGRDEQALALEAAEERYDPKAGDFGLSISERSGSEKTGSVSLGPSLRVPTGGNFRLSWSKPVAGPGDRSGTTSLTFSQPLLKGFGPDIDTWTLRSARLAERINVRAFRDRVSGIVGSVIGAYRGVLSAERRLTIAREALQRAERQLEINRALVEAGRMAPRDLVQTESTVANRQYSLTDAEVALDNANSGLINTLDLEEGGARCAVRGAAGRAGDSRPGGEHGDRLRAAHRLAERGNRAQDGPDGPAHRGRQSASEPVAGHRGPAQRRERPRL